jgi:hypothetical protein
MGTGRTPPDAVPIGIERPVHPRIIVDSFPVASLTRSGNLGAQFFERRRGMSSQRGDVEQEQLIAELAQEQVQRVAPQELPLYRATSKAYFENPEKMVEGQQDRMLGFGAEIGVAFLTPVVLSVTTEVFKFLADEVRKSVAAECSGVIHDLVKKMFKRFYPTGSEAAQTPPPLTSEQVTQVRRLAFDKARQLNVSEAQAGLLADSLIGSLVTTGHPRLA